MEKISLDKYSNLNIEELNLDNMEKTQQEHKPQSDSISDNSNPDEISFDEYEKKSEIDHLTILKIIIFLLLLGGAIFVFYHLFFGANGFISQKEKARELSEIKEIKSMKEQKLQQQQEFLQGLKEGNKELLEKLAREKGYIYPDEKIIKIPDYKKEEQIQDNREGLNNTKDKENKQEIIYLVISVSITILIIISSFFINKFKLKK
jgi:cell division protein FtsB